MVSFFYAQTLTRTYQIIYLLYFFIFIVNNYKITDMSSAKYSFVIEQGATFTLEVAWEDQTCVPINITGYSARMQIRPAVESEDIYISLSSELQPDGTGLNLSGSNGITPLESGSIGVYISAYSSSLLDFTQGRYDLEMVSGGGEVTRLLEGYVQLSKNVTR